MQKNHGRLAPLSGVGVVVFLLLGFILTGDAPDATKKPAAEVVKHYADQGDGVFAGLILLSLGLVLFVVFASYMRQVLGAAEGEDGLLPRVAFAGVVILAAGFSFDSTLTLTLHEGAEHIGPAGVQALSVLYDNDFVPMATGMFMFLVGIGVPIVRTGVLPKWLGVVALLLALVSLTPIGFVGFIGGGLLTAILGGLMAARAGRGPRAPAAT
jgi:hypothetical protein